MASIIPVSPPVRRIGNSNPPSGSSVARNLVAKATRVGGAAAPRHPGTTRAPSPLAYRRPTQEKGVPRTRGGQSRSNSILETKNKEPYNPLASPFKTQGQFNEGVEKLAKQEYQPQLSNIEGEESGEKNVTQERSAGLGNIYNTYTQQAQQAFQDAKSALAEIAAKNQAADEGAQKTLQAALGSTGAPVTSQTNALGTALAEGQIGSGALAGLQSAITGQAAAMEGVPATARTEALGQEMNRDKAARENLAAEKGKVIASIPNAIEKARQTLLTNEENRAGLAFQEKLADRQFGLSAKTQSANEQLANRQQGLNERKVSAEVDMNKQKMEEEFSLRQQELAQQEGLNLEKLHIEKEKIQNERGKAAGTRAKNAILIMTNFLKPQKNEYMPGQQSHEPNQILYHRDPNALFRMLTVQGGLGNKEAFQLMEASGHSEVESYAREMRNKEKAEEYIRNHPNFSKKLGKAIRVPGNHG